MSSEPKFTQISNYEQASQIYEYAKEDSNKYIGNENLCDFFDDDYFTKEHFWNYIMSNIIQNENPNKLLLDYIFLEEYDGKVFGYKDVSISKLQFFHPLTKDENWVVVYIDEMCSFSRLKTLSDKYGFKNIGKKLFDDFKHYLKNEYPKNRILIWLLSTENSKKFHLKNKMRSSGDNNRFLTQFWNDKNQTIYEMFEKKEYGFDDNNEKVLGKDEVFGENDLYYIIN